MYLLTDNNRPFAIIKNDWGYRIEQAIAEEFVYNEVRLIGIDEGETIFPDWGETKIVEFVAINADDEEEVTGTIGITKLINY